MLYPQNGDRIVTIDSVTSVHLTCVPLSVLAKFHYTDTDTDFFCGETPLGPCGSVRVRVRVVEFSYYGARLVLKVTAAVAAARVNIISITAG